MRTYEPIMSMEYVDSCLPSWSMLFWSGVFGGYEIKENKYFQIISTICSLHRTGLHWPCTKKNERKKKAILPLLLSSFERQNQILNGYQFQTQSPKTRSDMTCVIFTIPIVTTLAKKKTKDLPFLSLSAPKYPWELCYFFLTSCNCLITSNDVSWQVLFHLWNWIHQSPNKVSAKYKQIWINF